MSVIHSYVFYKHKCFLISTIERDSSAIAMPMRYNETLVWDYDWPQRKLGSLIHQDGACRGSIAAHQQIERSLAETGLPYE